MSGERVRVGIAGTGAYVPEKVVPNSWFESILDTSDEWIVQRTGIRERRHVSEGQATSDLAIEAGRRALEDAGIEARELDLILLATCTPDAFIPGSATLVQQGLGAENAGAFDINAACAGFLVALATGESFIAAGRARRVLVIGAEALTRLVDWTDRTSCILFGDGAGAAVLAPLAECGGRGEILRTQIGADGSGYRFIRMEAGGSRFPTTAQTVAEQRHYIRVEGREVYRFAVARMGKVIEDMLEGHSRDELGLVVPHQVNARIISAACERLGWSEEEQARRVVVNIDRYGNTSAASVPVALDEARRAGRLESGKLAILCAFGAGVTWGGALLRW